MQNYIKTEYGREEIYHGAIESRSRVSRGSAIRRRETRCLHNKVSPHSRQKTAWD